MVHVANFENKTSGHYLACLLLSLEIYSGNIFIYFLIFIYIKFYSLQMSLRTKVHMLVYFLTANAN